MSDVVRVIIIMSVSGSIIAAALFLLKPLTRNRLPKFTQYYLWLVVLFTLIVPVSQIIVLPSNQALPLPNNAEAPAFVPIISDTVTRFAITQTEYAQRSAIQHASQGVQATASAGTPQPVSQSTISLFMTYFVLIYPFGVLLLGLWFVASYLMYYGILCRRNIAAGPGYQDVLNQMCSGPVPRLYFNPLAATPMLLGIFKPKIILPDRDYTHGQLAAILAHELTHLRRKDILIKWLTLAISAIHWFNPLMWLIRREIDRACELACDEAVIQNLDPAGKKIYGNTLISVSAATKAPRAIASAMMCEDKKNLKERLGAIMHSKSHTKLAVIFSAVVLLLTACGALTLGLGSQEENTTTEITATTPPETQPSAQPTVEPTPPPQGDPIIYITSMNTEHLASFSAIHEFDFLGAYASYYELDDDDWFFTLDGEWGVVIWADIPLRGLQAIALNNHDTDGSSYVNAGHVFYELDILQPGTLFFINRFVTIGGVLPWEGISFIDPSGARRYFSIVSDRRGDPGDPPFFLFEFEDGSDIWGLHTPNTPTHLGLASADYLYASRIDLNTVARQTITTANQSQDSLVWVVQPTLPHQTITLCNCGQFRDQDWYVIDRETGQRTGYPHLGHGGPPPMPAYDAELGLFGTPGYGPGYHNLYGMHPRSEIGEIFSDWYYNLTRGLTAVQLVDSTRRITWDWYEGAWDLAEDARLGLYAIMYNHQFTTAFAFHDIRIARILNNFETVQTLPFAAVRIDDLWGVVDINGNIIIPYMFDDLTFINERTAFAKFNGAYGILDISGNLG
ncbi:MAG: hypothetical protein FWC78_05050 [Defluviitaleaceae bacterium]|nr:hypothetical protein [Defluviitaleaceae bacterium]